MDELSEEYTELNRSNRLYVKNFFFYLNKAGNNFDSANALTFNTL